MKIHFACLPACLLACLPACLPERGHGYRRAVSLCSRRGLPGLTAGIIESPCYPPWGQLEIHSWGGDSFCFAAGLRWPLLWQRPGVRRELAQGVNRGLPGNDAIPNGHNAFAVNLGLRCAWRQPTMAGSLCEFVALDKCPCGRLRFANRTYGWEGQPVGIGLPR